MVRWLAAAVPLVVTADEHADPTTTGVGTGRAGGLAALLAVHAETGLTAALQSARTLADRLAAAWDEPHERATNGMLAGAAGEGWALLRAAKVTGSQRYAEAGRTALRHDRDLGVPLDRAGGPLMVRRPVRRRPGSYRSRREHPSGEGVGRTPAAARHQACATANWA